MLRFLKMDLIAACLAVTSLFGLHSAISAPTSTVTPTDIQTPVSAKVVVPATIAANETKPLRKFARPFRALANLGIASWYGSVLEGHKTASGEIFHKDDLTACHRSLPFGTMVRVVDVTSGRSVIVRINDRGVLSPERIIDLSSGAAESLGILHSGVAKVRLEVLKNVERVEHLGLSSTPTDTANVASVADAPTPL